MAGAYGSSHKISSAISVCHCALSSTSVWICRRKRSEAIVIQVSWFTLAFGSNPGHAAVPAQGVVGVRVYAQSRRRPALRVQLPYRRAKTAALPLVVSILHPYGKA